MEEYQMAHIRAIILGMGYDTLQGPGGTPKAAGAIMKMSSGSDNEKDPPLRPVNRRLHELKYEVIQTPPRIPTHTSRYEMSLVTNYKELSQALGIECGLTGSFYADASLEARFFKRVELSQQTLSLMIRSETIKDVKHIALNGKLIPAARKLLKENLLNFIAMYGDSYVSEISYGKKLYAIIKYTNISRSELSEIKTMLQGHLNALGAPLIDQKTGVDLKITIEKKLSKINKNTIVDIQLDFAGVTIDAPDIGSDIDKLLLFIGEYNKTSNLKPDTIVGFSTKPFVTACSSFYDDFIKEKKSLFKVSGLLYDEHSFAETDATIEKARLLSRRITRVHTLLKQCDDCYKSLKFILPNIEKIVKGLNESVFCKESDAKKFISIKQLLTSTQQLLESTILIAEKIYENRVNPIDLFKIIYNHSNKSKFQDIDSKIRLLEEETNEKIVYDQIYQLLQKISQEISNVEADIAKQIFNLSVEIANISPNSPPFHLARLPNEGATILWKIHFKNEDKKIENNPIKFNLLTKKINDNNCITIGCGKLKSWRIEPEHRDISDGSSTRVKLQPQDQIKIQFLNRRNKSRTDFSIKAYITGPQIFDIENSRYARTWLSHTSNDIEIKPLPTDLQPSAFSLTLEDLQESPNSTSTMLNSLSKESLSKMTTKVSSNPFEELLKEEGEDEDDDFMSHFPSNKSSRSPLFTSSSQSALSKPSLFTSSSDSSMTQGILSPCEIISNSSLSSSSSSTMLDSKLFSTITRLSNISQYSTSTFEIENKEPTIRLHPLRMSHSRGSN
jgi:hypothetical protein